MRRALFGFLTLLCAGVCIVICACPCPCRTPEPTLGDGAAVALACQHLSNLGCAVAASDAGCVPAISNMVAQGMTPVDLPCMTSSPSKVAAAACVGMRAADCP